MFKVEFLMEDSETVAAAENKFEYWANWTKIALSENLGPAKIWCKELKLIIFP